MAQRIWKTEPLYVVALILQDPDIPTKYGTLFGGQEGNSFPLNGKHTKTLFREGKNYRVATVLEIREKSGTTKKL